MFWLHRFFPQIACHVQRPEILFFRMVQFLNVRPRISCQIQHQHDDEESFGTISINPYARSLISSHGKSLSFICSKCCDIFIFVADEIYFLQLEQWILWALIFNAIYTRTSALCINHYLLTVFSIIKCLINLHTSSSSCLPARTNALQVDNLLKTVQKII